MASGNYRDPYQRLQLYSDLLLRDDSYDDQPGQTMSDISSLFDIPVSIVRHDIISLHKQCAASGIFIIRPDDSFSDDPEIDPILDAWCDSDDYLPLYEDIKSGKYDDLPLSLSEDHAPTFRLSMSEQEYHALESLKSKLYQRKDLTYNIHVKDSFRFMSGSDVQLEMLGIINQAIDFKEFITFRYKDNTGERRSWTIAPYKIIYDSILNLYAVLTVVDDLISVFRLDRIIPVGFGDSGENYITITGKSIPDDHEIYSKKEYIDNITPYVWGMAYVSKPFNVKVKFAEFGNIKRKLERELSYRKGKLYQKDGFLYYEDKIYGKEAFKMWIRSYGRGAEVIKPLSLRREIKEALEKQLDSF